MLRSKTTKHVVSTVYRPYLDDDYNLRVATNFFSYVRIAQGLALQSITRLAKKIGILDKNRCAFKASI